LDLDGYGQVALGCQPVLRGPLVDSNSTRTESCVFIRRDLGAQTPLDAPKAADCNGYQQIIHLSQGKRAGLKTLLSGVPKANT
jgi:hypothetical protein